MSLERIKIKVSIVGDCKDPVIKLVGSDSNLLVNCINALCGDYEVQIDNPDGGKCFDFSVSCSNCTDCPPQIIHKCLCSTNSDCTNPCEFCDLVAGGVCNPKPCLNGCDSGVCLDDCIQCITNCPPGKICTPYVKNGKQCKKCSCPVGKFENSFGDCVDCINDTDCGLCGSCQGYKCKPKDCGIGICNPQDGICYECIKNADCGPNSECDLITKKCKCSPGYCKNAQGICEPCSCNIDEDCGPCKVCKKVNGINVCVPRECPPGYICDGNECKLLCDCKNPSSCPQGKACVNKGSYCVCESCGSCGIGCSQNCIDKCNQGLGCVPNPCGDPVNGQCGDGCGYNPVTGKCEPCDQTSCSTNCGNLLGCICDNGVKCKKDNSCTGNCKNGFDCGPNCTCLDDKCVPCSSLSCSECANHPKCKCNGKCEGNPSAMCDDKLSITKEGCIVKGTLETISSCPCPLITAKLTNTSVEVGVDYQIYNFRLELFKGNTTESQYRLDQISTPGIASNETPVSGAIDIDAILTYENENSIASYKTISIHGDLSNRAFIDFSFKDSKKLDKFGFNYTNEPNKTLFLTKIDFTATLQELDFINQCSYSPVEINRTASASNGFKFEGIKFVSSQDTKLPLFTWYKSATGNFTSKFKDVYATKLGNKFENSLDLPGESESCFTYKLESDCGCANPKSENIIFCSPPDDQVFVQWEKCNRIARVTIPEPCLANKNKQYSLIANVNGTDIVITTALSLVGGITYNVPEQTDSIKYIKLKLTCDVQDVCTITKYAPEVANYPITPDTACAGDKAKFTFTNDLIDCVTWKGVKQCGLNSYQYLEDSGTYSYVIKYKSGCKDYSGSVTWTCFESFKPKVDTNCISSKYIITNTFSGTIYKVDDKVVDVTNLSIYVEPKKLTYSNDLGSGEVSLPTKSSCCSTPFTFIATSVSSSSIQVDITGQVGHSYTIKLDGGLNQTVSGSASYTYTSVSQGIHTVSVIDTTNTICSSATQTVIVSNCNPILNTGNTGCSLTANTTGTCACKSITWTPKILSVTKTDSSILVYWDSTIAYQDAQVVNGKITVDTSTVSATLDNKGYSSGTNEILCEAITGPVASGQIVLHRATNNGIIEVTFPNLVSSGIVFTALDIATVNSTVDVSFKPATYNTITGKWTLIENDADAQFNNLYALRYTYTLNGTSHQVTVNPPGPAIGSYGSVSYFVNISGTTRNCISSIPVTFTLQDLELEDGCKYSKVTKSILITDFDSIPSLGSINLTASNPTERKIKYIWAKENEIKLIEFKSSGVNSLFNGVDSITSNYTVQTQCNCDSTKTLVSNCLQMPTFTNVMLYPTKVDFVIEGGCYSGDILVDIPGSTGEITVNKVKGTNTTTISINLSSPLTSTQYLTGKYKLKPQCTFQIPVTNNTYVVEVTPEACGTNSCSSTQYSALVRVKKDGSYIATNVNTVSPSGPTYNTGTNRLSCLTQGTNYTFNVIADGITFASSSQKNCTVSCTLNNTNVGTPTVVSPNPICLTTSNVIVNLPISVGGSFLYGIDGAAISTPLSGTISIPLGSSPYTHTIRVKESSEADSCAVTKVITFNPQDCTAPIVNCGANPPISNGVGVLSDGRCDMNVSDTITPQLIAGSPTTGGTAPYTYQWSIIEGTGTISAPTTALGGTITITGFSASNYFRFQLVTTDANGCTGTRLFSVSTPPTCLPGQVLCGTSCPKTCVPSGTCINGSECKSPDSACGSNCCKAPQVCAQNGSNVGSCVVVNQPCGSCSTYNSSGNCISNVGSCQCCYNGSIIGRFLNIVFRVDYSLGSAPQALGLVAICSSTVANMEVKNNNNVILYSGPGILSGSNGSISYYHTPDLYSIVQSNPSASILYTVTTSDGCVTSFTYTF